LTPLAAIPSTKYRWKNRYRMRMGIVDSTTVAINGGQFVENPPAVLKKLRPIGSV
jgi:hypothetical protein